MKTIDLIPEQIVEEFGIRGFIDKYPQMIKDKLDSCNESESTSFICGLIQIGSDTSHWKSAMEKYKMGVKSPIPHLSPYVLDYIRAQELKRK
jgi:hypothetical protein